MTGPYGVRYGRRQVVRWQCRARGDAKHLLPAKAKNNGRAVGLVDQRNDGHSQSLIEEQIRGSPLTGREPRRGRSVVARMVEQASHDDE